MFMKAVEVLIDNADERKTRKHKPLKYAKPNMPSGGGDNRSIWETKLDKGQRILWYPVRDKVVDAEGQARGAGGTGGKKLVRPMLMIAYVSKHDDVSRHMRLINDSRKRMERHQAAHQEEHSGDGAGARSGASWAAYGEDEEDYGEDHPLDPKKNVPWKIYRFPREQIEWLRYSDWEPPLKLSAEERSVVIGDSPNGVLLLGRSGTGKTICVISRMDRDRVKHIEQPKEPQPRLRQLFVARSFKLCAFAQKTFNDNIKTYKMAGEYSTEELDKAKKDMQCKNHDVVISLIEKHLDMLDGAADGNVQRPWKAERARDTQATAGEFFDRVWPELVSTKNAKQAEALRRLELDQGTVSSLLIDSIDSLDLVSSLLIDSIDSLDLVSSLQAHKLIQIYTITNCCLLLSALGS
jgi:hypothetical protein